MYKSNRRFVVDSNFIKNASTYKLNLNEFVLLMYFDNSLDYVVNIKNISKITKLKETDVMLALSSLIEKKLVEIKIDKDNQNKITELISLDGFYENLKKEKIVKEKEAKKEDIFSKFEKEFGRPLSQNDYQIIKVWLEKLYSEELILEALKEASYNGVSNIRYIDKILFEWNKKGIEKTADLKNNNKVIDSKNQEVNSSLLEYNWLDNE